MVAAVALAADLKTRPQIDNIPDTGVIPLFNNNTGMYQLRGNTLKSVIATTPQAATNPFSLPSHAGIWSAGTVTPNGDGTVTVAGNTASFYSDANKTTVQTFTITGGVVSLTDQRANYIVADHNTNTFVAITDSSLIDYVRYLPYAEVYRNGNNVHVQISPILGNGEIEAGHDRIAKTNRYARESGLDSISVNEYLEITISGGVVWVINKPYTIPGSSTSSRGFFEYHNAGVWNSTTALNPKINNSQYDNGTNLAALTDGYWNINYIYRGVEDQDHVYIVLSSNEYATAELAKSAGLIGDVPEIVTSHAMLVGRVIVQKGATADFVVESSFTNTFAGASAVSTHNNLSGIQGGTAGEYYHLTAAQSTKLVASSDSTDGYLTAADHALFSAKVDTTDPRLSDARTPLAHNQAASTITGLATVATSGSYLNLADTPPGVCEPGGVFDGKDGSKIYIAAGTPSDAAGVQDDMYIDSATWNLYTKGATVWTLAGNIKGADSTVPGPTGPQGVQGDPGPGVPAGGTDGQVLTKLGVTDYATHWTDPTSNTDWAGITGTLSAETRPDLYAAFAEKTATENHISATNNPHATTASQVGAEPHLGNPPEDGMVPSSTTLGVRSWTYAGSMTQGAILTQIATSTDGMTLIKKQGPAEDNNAALVDVQKRDGVGFSSVLKTTATGVEIHGTLTIY